MFVFNKIVPPQYVVGGSILIHVDEKTNPVGQLGDFLQANSFFGIERNFMNEIVILNSSPLMMKALNSLKLYTTLSERENLFYREMYREQPFRIELDTLQSQATEVEFYITFIDKNRFRIRADDANSPRFNYMTQKVESLIPRVKMDEVHVVGDVIKGNDFKFRILLTNLGLEQKMKGKKFRFKFNNMYQLASDCKKKLSIGSTGDEITVASMVIRQPDINKGKDILNAMINVYLLDNLAKKNSLADETINYIDLQLSTISDSLNRVERNLQAFRSSNEVTDISQKAERYFTNLHELESQKAQIEASYNYYQYIDKYFAENQDGTDLVAPSSLGIEDDLLNSLIEQLITLSQQKRDLIVNKQEKSPYLPQLTTRIDNLKNTITENLKSILGSTEISLSGLNERINQVNTEIRKLPGTERQLLGITRKFEINNEIYNFLLQRRIEAIIAKASNKPEHEIVEPPSFWNVAIPNPKINFTVAVFLGLILPIGFFALKQILDKSVQHRADVEKLTDLQIIGSIFHAGTTENSVFADETNKYLIESFRTIRTDLEFFSQDKKAQVYLVTSSHSGEGKSFFAFNIARTFAMNRKKTIYVGFDMRKHDNMKYSDLELEKSKGISSYLVNRAKINEIISSSNQETFDYITPGSIPPNPLELLSSNHVAELFTYLKTNYDIIIVDTPPIGIVADAFVLMQYADFNLFIVRQKVTSRSILENSLAVLKSKSITRAAVIMNDVTIEAGKYRKYGYKSYIEKKKDGILKRWVNSMRKKH
jgi:capsular exopolysaccharide synthesis family protein